MGLEEVLQQLHEAGKPVEISWLWDGGVDVKARGEERNFPSVNEVLPWLRHWYGMKATAPESDSLEAELQKIYDSEINITIRAGADSIVVGLGNDFTGLDVIEKVRASADILPWLQTAIHAHYPASKYAVERLGGIFTPTWVEIPD